MTMDLNEVLDWSEVIKFSGGDTKININLQNQATWKNIASKICYIGRPVKISNKKGVLRVSLGSDSLRQVVKDLNN